MKIMFVDTSTYGHHLVYLNNLLQAASGESFAVLPKNQEAVAGRCIMIPKPAIRSFSSYRKWIKDLRKTVEEEHPDIIHFLDGDTIMRYFGWGFTGFGDCRIVITFHHFFPGRLRKISMKSMLKRAAAGVFHTENIAEKVKAFGCGNVYCIPYPCFLNVPMQRGEGYKSDPPVLLALGGTRHEKGLDLLLEALDFIEQPFHLIIAGGVTDFDEHFVEKAVQKYHQNVEWNLRLLTDEEVLDYMQRSDIIVLPYRRVFDGASGPMCDGVYLGKTILGPNHGSLGELIWKYHVGYTFESESTADLIRGLSTVLSAPFIYDGTAEEYQKALSPEKFKASYLKLYEQITAERGK
ncbi:MAG: glycosyltransferase family 4 protein [Lachnospiraceae bacterium]|nr:glycosyltransferase family 4 protein [Lachnospiraceae bacterium]